MSSKNSDSRTRILQSAWKLLEDGGGVSMSEIARAAGISRQALYLHFPNRADLLIATARHIDDVKDVEARFAASRAARTGVERLDAFIEAWGNYIPEIFGVAKALMAVEGRDRDVAGAADEEARAGGGPSDGRNRLAPTACADRMLAVRDGCAAAVQALIRDGRLAPGFTAEQATDLLWTLLSIEGWQQLTQRCGWPQELYVEVMKRTARKALVEDG